MIRCAQETDHPALLALWRCCEGIQLRDEDAFEPFCAYLRRNPGLSLVLELEGRVVGSLLVGHDGRRGYLQHLAVESAHRGRGHARALLEEALRGLAEQGIGKSHVFVLREASAALSFWIAQDGWGERRDIEVFSTQGGPKDA